MKKAYVYILLAAALWGIIGIWSRGLMAGGFSSWSIVVVRNFGGLAALNLFFLIRGYPVFRIARKDIKYFFGTGVVSVMFFTLCYFSCQQVCSLAVAATLLYTAPTIVVLLSAVLWKEKITRQKKLALLLTLLGCSLVTGLFSGSVVVTLQGALLGLGAGFFYALYSIFGRYALERYDALTVTYWTFVFCGSFSLVFCRQQELSLLVTQPCMTVLALCMVIFSTVLPYMLYTSGLAVVRASQAAIMASLEPVVAAMVGIFMFGELLDVFTALGVGCVLAGICVLNIKSKG